MSDQLPPAQEKLLVATRCFGRGTPFPHRMLQNVWAQIDDTPYEQVTAALLKQILIKKEGKLGFSLTSAGSRLRGSDPVPAAIWDAVIATMKLTVAQAIDANEKASVDWLTIHTAAIANTFSTRIPPIHMEMLGLSIICLEYLGRTDDAEVYKRRLQTALDAWHDQQTDDE